MEPAAPTPTPKRTVSEHRIAIQKMSGEIEVVEADEYRAFQCTKECVQFWATTMACAVLLVFGVVMMCVRGQGDPLFPMWSSMAALGAGVLIPSPDYMSAFKVPRPAE